MSSVSSRTFEDVPAIRQRVPLLVGLVGPSGSGKTFSALRLATGVQKAIGGDIYYIDTEARRALHYADLFKFRHLAFGAPFGPTDYLAAVEHCAKKGAKTIIVDSMSHEHDGPGGVLEMHQAELERLGGSDKMNFLAWQKPKAARRRLLNSLLQIDCNFIFCFRAKEKLKMVPGKQPQPLGWMPIAGEEFVYEMSLNILLYPNCGGVPQWHPDEAGEQAMIKLPSQFRPIFEARAPLSEDIGAKLAEWAAGGVKHAPEAAPVVTIDSVSETSKDGKTVYVIAAGEKSYATIDPEVAALASSCLHRLARLTSTTTVRGGLKLTGVEPIEEAA